MSIGYEFGKWLGRGCPLPQKKEQQEVTMTDDEVDAYFSMKEFFNRYERLEQKHEAWLRQEQRKAEEGMTLWNYVTKTGKFEGW